MTQSFLKRFTNNKLATFGLIILLLVIIIAAAAPVLDLPDPNRTRGAMRLMPPGTEGHPLGTDGLGRDMLARIIWGTRVSLAVGFSATLIAALIGSLIGIFAAFYSGPVDNVLMRGVDMLMAFPYMLLALSIVAVLGPGLFNALIAISIVNIPFFARNVRGATVSLTRLEYVDAARVSGLSDMRILFGELLPNVLPVIFITISTTVGWMILETAGLSFLGLGAQPPRADLGSMLGQGREAILIAPHVATIPGLVILVIVIGINLVGDGLRDVLDPYLRSGSLVSPAPATAVAPALLKKLRGNGSKRSHAAGAADSRGKESAGEEPQDTLGDTSENILTVRNLRTYFSQGKSQLKAVDDVSFGVRRGQVLGVMGESGSGKSVTALSVLGLVPTPPGQIIDGSVKYDEQELLGLPLGQLQRFRGGRISYIFQNPMTSLNPLLSVGEQIAEAIRRHQDLPADQVDQKVIDLMTQVYIPNAKARKKFYPHELSGGMRQRVGIAIALANDPDIIIADEPTTALDVTIQAQILQLLDELCRKRGLALVLISHDFGVISQICDRVVVMYAGQIVESGTIDEVYRRPLHPYTRRLMECVPKVGSGGIELKPIPGLPPALEKLTPGCRFADRCDMAIDACRGTDIPMTIEGRRKVRCIRAEISTATGAVDTVSAETDTKPDAQGNTHV